MLDASVSLDVNITSQDVLEAHRNRLKDAANVGYAVSQEEVPHETGKLKASGFSPVFRGNDVVYGYSAAYAESMEFGTNPGHYPPVQPLVEWAQRIGKDAGFGYYVARHVIPERGVQPQPYLRPSAKRVQSYLDTHDLDL